MEFDFARLGKAERYKLLCSVVVPRPIALVTTVSPEGVRNAAPFSFFNCLSYEPPVVVLAMDDLVPEQPKDTVRNIRLGREFVVNAVTEDIVEAMNVCAIDFPREVDELAEAGFTTAPAQRVAVPRIAESPVNLECRERLTIELGAGRHIILGEVLHLHIRDDLVDPDTLYVDGARLRAVGRLFGGGYCRTTDRFELPRIPYADWRARKPEP